MSCDHVLDGPGRSGAASLRCGLPWLRFGAARSRSGVGFAPGWPVVTLAALPAGWIGYGCDHGNRGTVHHASYASARFASLPPSPARCRHIVRRPAAIVEHRRVRPAQNGRGPGRSAGAGDAGGAAQGLPRRERRGAGDARREPRRPAAGGGRIARQPAAGRPDGAGGRDRGAAGAAHRTGGGK